MKTPNRILRLPEVERLTGYKRSSIYRMAKERLFPQQRRIGPGAVGWDSQEVETWIEEKLDRATSANAYQLDTSIKPGCKWGIEEFMNKNP